MSAAAREWLPLNHAGRLWDVFPRDFRRALIALQPRDELLSLLESRWDEIDARDRASLWTGFFNARAIGHIIDVSSP